LTVSERALDFIHTKAMALGYVQSKEEPVTEYSYTVLFEPAEEGGYVAFCPALPGLLTEGETYEEIRERVKEAIEGYLESLVKDGQPIPPDKLIALEPVKEEIRIAPLNPHEPAPACPLAGQGYPGA
jgi:antitoxin HicB